MIVPIDEKRGRFLLAEILDGGNFGRHFTKDARFTHQSMRKKYFLKIWRNMPVSYTHLEAKEMRESANSRNRRNPYLKLSYPNGDVYKRQVLHHTSLFQ